MRERANTWLGPARLLLRVRSLHPARDPGRTIQALARGVDGAVGVRLGGQRAILLVDPDLVRELFVDHAGQTMKGPGLQSTRPLLGDGLLTSEGEHHRRARRLVAPAFSPRRLADYTRIMADCARLHSEEWQAGETADMHRRLAELTLDIVGRTLFGGDLRAAAPGVRDALETALAAFDQQNAAGGRRRRVPSGLGERALALMSEGQPLRVLIDSIIAEHREALVDSGDIVSALVSATGEDGSTLSDQEIRDEVVTLLMAGHETTANALTWTLHLLGEHPEVAERLRSELATELGDALPTFDVLPRLTYTRAVVTESMRLYPPAWIIGRTVTESFALGDWQVPAGALVGVSPYVQHRRAEWFPEPLRFDPERWLDARRTAVPKHAYLPFGLGPRSCIGEQFAWTEAITVLAVLAPRWSARTVPSHVVAAEYRVTMRPRGGMPMELTPIRKVTRAADGPAS